MELQKAIFEWVGEVVLSGLMAQQIRQNCEHFSEFTSNIAGRCRRLCREPGRISRPLALADNS